MQQISESLLSLLCLPYRTWVWCVMGYNKKIYQRITVMALGYAYVQYANIEYVSVGTYPSITADVRYVPSSVVLC